MHNLFLMEIMLDNGHWVDPASPNDRYLALNGIRGFWNLEEKIISLLLDGAAEEEEKERPSVSL